MKTFSSKLVFSLVLAVILGFGVSHVLRSSQRVVQAQSNYPTVSIAPDGFMVINGKRTFMYGFNHVADNDDRYGTPLAQDMERIGKAGFNLVQVTLGELDNTIEALNVIKKHGMYNIASYYTPNPNFYLGAMASGQYSDVLKSTVIGWNTGDDFNTPYDNPKYTPTSLKQKNDTLKAQAATFGLQILTFGSAGGFPFTQGTRPYLIGDYKNSMDLIATQSYPISNNDGSFAGAPLEENIQYYKYARVQLGSDKLLFANGQTFSWGDPGSRYPTPCESRNMTWAALISGVNGILNYTYHDELDTLHSSAPSLWVEQIRLRRDINGRFEDAVVNGTRTEFASDTLYGKAKVHAATWDYTEPGTNKKYVYVAVINTDQTKLNTVQQKIKLPASVAGLTKKPLFGNSLRYGNGMNVQLYGSDFYLDGSINAQETQVYVFE